MKLEDINPFVRQALVGTLDRSHVYDVDEKIKTVDCRFFYIMSGEGRIIIEGEEYAIFPGTAVLFSAGTEYIWNIEKVKYYVINFDYTTDFSDVRQTFHPIHSELFDKSKMMAHEPFEDEVRLNRPIVLRGIRSLEHIAEHITTEYLMGGDCCDMLLSSLLKSAIATMVRVACRDEAADGDSQPLLVRRIIAYINESYEKPITNEDIAAIFNFSSIYLNRVFKSYTGSSIHSFLIDRRIKAAMEMLRSQTASVGEVAERCGFGNQYHFAKMFRRRTGMSPTDYRSHGTM